MHNIDVLHQEHNVDESILSVCMGFMNKTKDNQKVRSDLAQLCNRPPLQLTTSGGKPRALFCLKPKERKEALIWLQNLKFLNGYATSFRWGGNLESGKLSGVKSHDYQIFMERHLLVIFCGYLNDDVWKVLAELSHFYRQLYTKEIKKEMMEKLEKKILVLLCKLEKIFPPRWFNPT
jgi:hypothetical protein